MNKSIVSNKSKKEVVSEPPKARIPLRLGQSRGLYSVTALRGAFYNAVSANLLFDKQVVISSARPSI